MLKIFMFNTHIVEHDNQIRVNNRALKVKASKDIILLQILNCSFAVGERRRLKRRISAMC